MKRIHTLLHLAIICGLAPRADASPKADPQRSHAFVTTVGDCGPPRLLPYWNNITVSASDRVRIYCPLDQHNSCLIDMVEWYYSARQPVPGSTSGRKMLRDAAAKFDPLLVFIPRASPEHEGWYTCVVANGEGKREISTFLAVESEDPQPPKIDLPRPATAAPPAPSRLQMKVEAQSQDVDEEAMASWPYYDELESSSEAPAVASKFQATNVESRFPVYSQFRYIYDKMDRMSVQMDEIEKTVKVIERRV